MREEFKRKLEQGPVDHEVEFKCKVYQNGRVIAGPHTLRSWPVFPSVKLEKEAEYVATRSG